MQRTNPQQLSYLETLQERVTTALLRFGTREWWLPWLYLVCLVIAELVTSLVHAQLGLLMYLLILVGLTAREADDLSAATRRMMMGLALAPPLRVLSLVLPRSLLLHLSWYPAVALLFATAAGIILRQVGISRRTLGLTAAKMPLQLSIGALGMGFGAVEYLILRPQPLLATPTVAALLLLSINLLVFTGFTGELVFRGLLQTLVRPVLGRMTILYVALLSSILHIGFLSVGDVVFAFIVGVMSGLIVRRTRSIVGVAVAHGLASLVLFLALPYVAQRSAPATVIAVIGVCLLAAAAGTWSALRQWKTLVATPQTSPASISARLRVLRRLYGMTYAEVAVCTGIPVRELAAIEHGLQSATPERVVVLRRLLGELPPQRADTAV